MRCLKFALACLLPLSVLAPAAHAQVTYFPNDLQINAPITGTAVLGYANEDDFNNFANFTHPNSSLVAGGSVSVDLVVAGGTNFTMSGGSAAQLELAEGVTAAISGGDVTGWLLAAGFPGFNPTLANISGGTFGGISVSGSAIVTMSGGHTAGIASVESEDAIFTLTGGDVGDEIAVYSGTANVGGGSVGDVVVGDGSANIRGGNSSRGYFLTRTGALTFYGLDLNSMLVNPAFFFDTDPSSTYSQYALNGHLLDGTLLTDATVLIADSSSRRFSIINSAVTPEPSTFALFAAGGLSGAAFLKRRKTVRL